jgi:amidase
VTNHSSGDPAIQTPRTKRTILTINAVKIRIASRAANLFAVSVTVGLLVGCTSPLHFTKLRGDRAFITYTPSAGENGKTRLAVKDIIDVKGTVTTAGSQYFARNGTPAAEDAECLKGARARGVIIVGKTNLTELALGASGLNDYFGTPRNHLDGDKRLMPGGSSSGSAVAVATGKADVAYGTDTAGSIRTPAACCGIFGLKTTFGLVSLKGVYPLSPGNLDTVGPMATSVPRLVEGMDMLKPGTAAQYREVTSEHSTASGLRVGRLYIEGTDPAIDRAVDRALQKAGFRVVRLNAAFTEAWKQATKNGQVVAEADGYKSNSSLLKKHGVTGTTKTALLLGNLRSDSKAYDKAIQERSQWQRLLRQLFKKVDFIALPTLKKPPMNIPLWGRFATFEARALGLQNTVAVNYAGNPAIAIPIPLEEDRVPLTSLQLVGPMKSEVNLLNAARILASKKG